MGNNSILHELARAKAAFQLRAIEAVICAPAHGSKHDQNMQETPMTAPDTDTPAFGFCEGDLCNRNGCSGYIETHPSENCSCHIAPPCGSCTSPRNFCPVCDWREKDDPMVVMEISAIYLAPIWGVERKKRILDPTKIDYRVEMHSNSSQLCIGVYPPNTSMKDVEAVVRGTFGGRFNKFSGGHFEYVAYTD